MKPHFSRLASWLLAAVVLVPNACKGPNEGDVNQHKMIALIIGNGDYRNGIPKLANPPHDAAAVAAAFRRLGFQTLLVVDANREEMIRAIHAFARSSNNATAAVFFYSGHAMEINGNNILVPIDFSIPRSASPGEFLRMSLPLADIDAALAPIQGPRLIFLDSCRTDPFTTTKGEDSPASGQLPYAAGLAAQKPRIASAIIYATQPGHTARDGAGAFSPFSTAMIQNLDTRGLSLPEFLQQLKLSVAASTANGQVPSWDESNLPTLMVAPAQNATASGEVIPRMVTRSMQQRMNSTPASTVQFDEESSFPGLPLVFEQGRLPSNYFCEAHATQKWTRSEYGGGTGTIVVNRDGQACAIQIYGFPGPNIPAVDLKVGVEPEHGRVVIQENSFGYIPDTGFVGSDRFAIDALAVSEGQTLKMHGLIRVLVK